MESFKEFFQSIFESSSERMKSPLIGAYIISFIIYNWRAILILIFSGSSIETRIDLINGAFCTLDSLLIPFWMTLFYVIILPYIHLGLDFILAYSLKAKNNKEHKNKIKKLQAKIEEAELERQIADSRAGTSQINDLSQQVDLLKEQNNNLLQKSNSDLESFNQQITALKEAESNIIEINKSQTTELAKVKQDYSRLLQDPRRMMLPDEIMNIINELSHEERRYFVEICDFKVFKKRTSGLIRQDLLVKYANLEMIDGLDTDFRTFKLTPFGKIVYEYIDQEVPF